MLQQNFTEEDEEVEYVLREKIKIPDLDLSKFIQSIRVCLGHLGRSRPIMAKGYW
ncbi:MAG: hypothetical protein ACJ71F_15545 [Nitrososphaeraceae archaeon]